MLYDAESGDFNLGLLGDVMLTRGIAQFREPAFVALRDLLIKNDAVFANLEGSVRRADEGAPGITVGTYMTTAPELLDDIKGMGIGIVSCANNHAYDYGEAGLLATIAHLDAARIAHAGSGANLAEARAPAYVDTPRGRLALVAATSTYRPWNRAAPQRPDMRGRPGVNPLGFKTSYQVDAAALAQLRAISERLGFAKAAKRDSGHFFSPRELGAGAAGVKLAGQSFVEGDDFAIRRGLDQADLDDNLRWIRDARRQADFVLASIHSHEAGARNLLTAETKGDLSEPAEINRAFAHAAIDAGADAVAGHGFHTILGIELYKGRPIFHGLGNFIFMNESVRAFPAEAYERFDLGPDATPADFLDARTNGGKKGHPADPLFWQSAAVTCHWRGGALREIRLYPVDLGHGLVRAQRGRPVLADAAKAQSILERLDRLSQSFGTKISRDGDCGVIRL